MGLELLEELFLGLAHVPAGFLEKHLPAAPGQHDEGHDAGEQQREPAAFEKFQRIGREENQIDQQEESVDRRDQHWIVAPLQGDQRGQQGRNGHQERHRNAIGAGERVRGLEGKHRCDRRDCKQPVHRRHIDLSDRRACRVPDLHARQEVELHRLLRQGICAGNDRLRCDDCGERREDDERVMRPIRRELIERIVNRARIGEQQCALAEIVQCQGRQNDREPGNADWDPTEMAEIGIHGLTAGYRQEGGAEHEEADVEPSRQALRQNIFESREWIHRREDLRRFKDALDPKHRKRQKPEQHDRAKDFANESCAAALDGKQPDQHDDGDRNDVRGELRRIDLHAFDGAQHRYRRRDCAIARRVG